MHLSARMPTHGFQPFLRQKPLSEEEWLGALKIRCTTLDKMMSDLPLMRFDQYTFVPHQGGHDFYDWMPLNQIDSLVGASDWLYKPRGFFFNEIIDAPNSHGHKGKINVIGYGFINKNHWIRVHVRRSDFINKNSLVEVVNASYYQDEALVEFLKSHNLKISNEDLWDRLGYSLEKVYPRKKEQLEEMGHVVKSFCAEQWIRIRLMNP